MTVRENLNFRKHINHITGETYDLLRNVKAAFTHLLEDMMKKLKISMSRPRLEYAALVRSPNLKKDLKKLERIQ